MKIICPRVLTPLVIFAAAASVKIVEGGIEASAYYEDANCTSSALVVNIGGDCSGDTFSCPVYDTPGTSEMCFPDLTVLLTTGLGGGRHLVVEYYTDADCTSLSSAGAYLADGLCHEFTQFDGSRQSETTVVSSNGSVSVVGTLGGCKSSDTFYHAYPIPSANITGECIAVDMPPRGDANMTHGAKFYYVPSTSSATGSGSSSATGSLTPTSTPTTTTNATTATSTSSGASLGFVSTLFCATLTAIIALV